MTEDLGLYKALGSFEIVVPLRLRAQEILERVGKFERVDKAVLGTDFSSRPEPNWLQPFVLLPVLG